MTQITNRKPKKLKEGFGFCSKCSVTYKKIHKHTNKYPSDKLADL